jgi:hypothetical protein
MKLHEAKYTTPNKRMLKSACPPSCMKFCTLASYASTIIYRCIALLQLLYRWQHQSQKLWIPPLAFIVTLIVLTFELSSPNFSSIQMAVPDTKIMGTNSCFYCHTYRSNFRFIIPTFLALWGEDLLNTHIRVQAPTQLCLLPASCWFHTWLYAINISLNRTWKITLKLRRNVKSVNLLETKRFLNTI